MQGRKLRLQVESCRQCSGMDIPDGHEFDDLLTLLYPRTTFLPTITKYSRTQGLMHIMREDEARVIRSLRMADAARVKMPFDMRAAAEGMVKAVPLDVPQLPPCSFLAKALTKEKHPYMFTLMQAETTGKIQTATYAALDFPASCEEWFTILNGLMYDTEREILRNFNEQQIETTTQTQKDFETPL